MGRQPIAVFVTHKPVFPNLILLMSMIPLPVIVFFNIIVIIVSGFGILIKLYTINSDLNITE